MPQIWNDFIHAFVPLFVAVDAFGLLPLYVGLTEGLDRPTRGRILRQSIITALLVSVGFVFFGKVLFEYMGIRPDDFKVAGGVLLFVISTLDLVTGFKRSRRVTDSIGAVPLGTPLIAGPAVLTTSLILVKPYGLGPTVASLVVNILIAAVVLRGSDLLTRLLGSAGLKAVSKVSSLILAAFAVMMIRMGLVAIVASLPR